MKLPSSLLIVIDQRDAKAAVNDLCIVGRPTPTNCLGACAVRREMFSIPGIASGKIYTKAVDVHYTRNCVSVKRGNGRTVYYRKDAEAMKIDKIYDEVFIEAVRKFGDTSFWTMAKVWPFVDRRLKELYGNSAVLSKVRSLNRGQTARDVNRRRSGRTGITCQNHRTLLIERALNRSTK